MRKSKNSLQLQLFDETTAVILPTDNNAIPIEMLTDDEIADEEAFIDPPILIDNPFAGLEWSYSKRHLLERCNLAFYYNYYGANKLKARNEANKEELHFLKQLRGCYEVIGTHFHSILRQYFGAAQRGTFWSVEFLVKLARSKIKADRDYSKEYVRTGIASRAKNPPNLLHEYYYGQADVDQIYTEMEDRLVEALRNFANEAKFREFRLAGGQPSALVERRISLKGFPFRVTGQLDLAYQTETEDITVVDWKTGVINHDGNDSLQLGIYLLWILDYYNCQLDQVRICKAYLNANEVVNFKVDEKLLATVKARIFQDTERMRVLHQYGTQAENEAFTPCNQPLVCGGCSFRKVCYDRNER